MDRAYEGDETRDLGDEAGRAAEGAPESQMGLPQGSVQAAERGRAAVPTQGLPAASTRGSKSSTRCFRAS